MARPAGIIDTLSAGYSLVNRRLWLLAIPVGLDLFLWQGPRLTASTIVRGWFAPLLAESSTLPADASQVSERLREAMEALSGFNLVGLLAFGLVGIPSYLAVRAGQGPATELLDGATVALMAAALLVLGALIAAAYYTLIADEVRGGSGRAADFTARVARGWVRLLALTLLFLAGSMALGVPTALVVGLAPALAPLALAGVWVVALVGQFYLFFTPEAMFVDDVAPLPAARRSLQLASRHFGAALRLILLTVIIGVGMGVVWDALSGTPLGMVAAIVGSAYISTGLIAAAMIFYRARSGGVAAPGRRADT